MAGRTAEAPAKLQEEPTEFGLTPFENVARDVATTKDRFVVVSRERKAWIDASSRTVEAVGFNAQRR